MLKRILMHVFHFGLLLVSGLYSEMSWAQNFFADVQKEFIIGDSEESKNEILFSIPMDLVLDKDKNIYILDPHFIAKFNSSGILIMNKEFSSGKGPGEFIEAYSLSIDENANIYILDRLLRRISIFNKSLTFLNSFQIQFGAQKVAWWQKNELILLGGYQGKILHVISTSGDYKYAFGDPFSPPTGLENFSPNAFEWYVHNNAIYIPSPFKAEIREYESEILKYSYQIREINLIPPQMTKSSRMIGWMFPSGINGLVFDKNRILFTTYTVTSELSEWYFYIFDLKQKKFLKKYKLTEPFRIEDIDDEGRLYLAGPTKIWRVSFK